MVFLAAENELVLFLELLVFIFTTTALQ